MKQHTQVLIIGAGFAGLAAAHQLRSANIDYQIIEARDRAGGRAWTSESLGVPLDLGAFVIHSAGNNPLLGIAQQLNLRMLELKLQNIYFPKDKNQFSTEQFAVINEQFELLLDKAEIYAKTLEQDISLEKALLMVFDIQEFPALTPMILQWKKLFLAHYTSANLNKLSAKHWRDSEDELVGGNILLLDGYKPIVDTLANGLNIQYNTTATEIKYNDSSVTVLTSKGEITADYVIVTIPLGVLKTNPNLFSPSLPINKLQALINLEMGILDKLFLKFPQQFWPDDAFVISELRTEYSKIAWFINYATLCQQPILIGMESSSLAVQFEDASDEEVVMLAMQTLRDFFGNDIPNPVQSMMTRWNQDPYSLGAYSYIPVNASGADYDALAEPVANRLFFAGEGTNKKAPGMTHGAYLSGLRAANEIINLS